MKKLLPIIIGASLVLLPLRLSFASDNIAYASLKSDDGMKLSVGVGTKVVGSLWLLEHMNIGTYGSLTTDLAVMGRSGRFSGGLLAGPNIEWGNGESESLLTYLTMASGVLGAYDLNEKFGINIFARYHFDLDGATTYVDGWSAGLGGHLRF